MTKRLIILAVTLVGSRAAHAQFVDPPTPGHTCVNCSDSSSSSSSSDNSAAIAAENANRERIDRENKERERHERYIHNVRSANEDGVGAARSKRWSLAIKHFQDALKLDPNNALAQQNLAEAQNEQAAEQQVKADERAARERYEALEQYRRALQAEQRKMAKIMAAGIPVPPPGSGPTVTAPRRIDSSMRATVPDGDAMIQRGIAFFGDRLKDEALGHIEDMMDIMTLQGYVRRVEYNHARIWREEVPRMLTGAVNGDISPDDPLTLKFVTMMFNVGTGPGEMAQKIVEVGDAGKVFYDEAKWRAQQIVTSAANKGVESIAAGLGAAAVNADPKKVAADVKALLNDVKDAKAVAENWTKVIVGDKTGDKK